MDALKQQFSKSVMSLITLSLISIIAVASLSIFISFWISELADKDARAVNLSGAMRMQTYRIGIALHEHAPNKARADIERLDQTWNDALFNRHQKSGGSGPLYVKFQRGYQHWTNTLMPEALESAARLDTDTPVKKHLNGISPASPTTPKSLEHQVELTDQLVRQFQLEAEGKIRSLRSFQVLSLFITTLVGSLIFFLLKHRIEKPLDQLTKTVHRLGKGDYSQRVNIQGEDELGLLAKVFNQMSESIESAYGDLERRVEERTSALNRQNTILEFLFNNARKVIEAQPDSFDHAQMIDDLANALGVNHVELCLFTALGSKPYMHISPHDQNTQDCSQRSCENCKAQAPFSQLTALKINNRYPVVCDEQELGVISLNTPLNHPLESWQEQLLCSAADQLAIALSLNLKKDQAQRLAMLSERTVMARELHDSLAQSLSYLQIQVTRLQKSKDKQKWELQQAIIDELREGLSSAYRQLRELLTTFRLKMDDKGLRGALENTVAQIQQRSDIKVNLDYQLEDLPLSSAEQIHLLQIVREASQNAMHHSKGSRVDISLHLSNNNQVELHISDDGVGIHQDPEKLNHYGLAIMNERARHLNGQISVSARAEGGTQVELTFVPQVQR